MTTNRLRRDFLSQSALGAAALGLAGALPFSSSRCTAQSGELNKRQVLTAREYLKSLLYTKEEVRQWLAGQAFPFAKYSSQFGWLLRDARFQDGMNDSISVYTYGPLDERITIQYKDRPCRINTYGNSYTQCH